MFFSVAKMYAWNWRKKSESRSPVWWIATMTIFSDKNTFTTFETKKFLKIFEESRMNALIHCNVVTLETTTVEFLIYLYDYS